MSLGKKVLEKQGYRFTGEHSSVKICDWTKKAIRGDGVCYKQKFYGINTLQCVQMTPTMICPNRCEFCWRSLDYYNAKEMKEIDEPKKIIENAIKQQIELLRGFGGNKKVDKNILAQALQPKHFAISLTGEPTIYPKLNELIKELHKRNISSFLVTNGQFPEALEKLEEQPTQLYLSLDAPTKELYKKIDNPMLKDYWERFNKSLEIISKLDSRTVIRITAVKKLNMTNEKDYAKLIKKANPKFVEIKSYSWVGESRERLEIDNVPSYDDCLSFAEKIAELIDYKVIDTHKESKAILLAKEDSKDRILKFL
tara:strand:+ start:1320 stop:2252 length:933 start_codon:yes stop_codon:yes gene_type:complete